MELPAQVKTVGWNTYEGCSGLTDIRLPDGLETIYAYAFGGCTGIKGIDLPDSISTMGYRVFQNCTSLETANYPKNWTNTPGGNGAGSWERGGIFYGCSSMKSITIPEGITSVVPYAFQGCAYIKQVELPDSLISIGEYAFEGCSGLTEIKLPASVRTIGWNAYGGCTGVSKTELPEGLKTIYAYAFEGCTGVRNIVLPDSIETLGYRVFQNCTNLAEANYPKSWINTPSGNGSGSWEYGEIFYNCSSLRTLTIPEGVTEIPAYAFQNCNGLEQMALPASAQRIGNYAFNGCSSLEAVWVGEGVNEIGENSFENCPQLVMHGIASTYAEVYAKEKGITFSTDLLDKENQTVCGYVKDEQGRGIEGVSISLYNAEKNKTAATVCTDGDGYWSYGKAVAGSTYRLRMTHPRYRFENNNVILKAGEGGTRVDDIIGEKILEETVEEGGSLFTYSALNGSYIRITGYSGNKEYLVMPENIDGYTVQEIGEKAFQNNKTLKSVLIPSSVAMINASAFSGCTSLQTVGLSEGLKTISGSVFAGCTSLTDINLPGSLERIYAYAFSGCIALTAISLPDSVKTMGYRVFNNCTNLSEANYPMGWEESPGGNGAGSWECGDIFYGCTSLTAITVPEGVTKIAPYAFSQCTALTDIYLPESLEKIGNYAFAGCTGLTRVELPAQVKTIEWNAYERCTSLMEIRLPDGLETLNAYAFSGCTGLRNIDLPDNIKTMGYRVFQNCTSLETANYPKNWTNTPGGNGAGSWEQGGIFYGCSSMKSITIPEGITNVVPYAFQDCAYIKQVELPDSLISVGEYAFAGCSGLTEIKLPASVRTIGWNAYEWCSGATRITLPEGLKTICAYAFGGCTEVKSLELPDSIETMGFQVFRNCTKLTEVNYPRNWTNTPSGNGAGSWENGEIFYNCSSLRTLIIPEGVTEIPPYAFRNCTYLRTVVLPSTLQVINKYAFYNCIGMPAITFNNRLETIGSYAFFGCDGFISLTLSESIQAIEENSFAECGNLVNVSLAGNNLKTIANEAFRTCPSLFKIDIPSSTEAISKSSFKDSKEVVIYCRKNSYALEYAIFNDIMYYIIDEDMEASGVLNQEESYFVTNKASASSTGYIDFVLSYNVKEELRDQMTDMRLKIVLPSTTTFIPTGVKIDGKRITSYTYNNNVLEIPVTKMNGVLRFSVNPAKSTVLFSLAKFYCKENGTEKQEAIDIIDENIPVLTVTTNQTTNTPQINLRGIAPAQSKLTFRIGEDVVGSTMASRAGNYNAAITIPNPEEGKSYVITASAPAEEGAVENSVSVKYSSDAPMLEELLLYYWGHDNSGYYNRVIDIANGDNTKNTITFNPGYEYTFTVKMTNHESIKNLYVTSTRNGVVKHIEAKWNEEKQCYITEDKFDGTNTNYVPGIIGVEYNLSYEKIEQQGGEAVAKQAVEEYKNQYDFSKDSLEIKENTKSSLNCIATLEDGNQVEYDYRELSEEELYLYFVENGYISQSYNLNAREAFDITKLLEDILESYIVNGVEFYTGQMEDDFITVVHDDTEKIFKTWVVKSAIQYAVTDDLAYYYFQQFGDMTPYVSATNTVSFAFDAGKSTFTFLGKMWELDMQIRPGMTESEKAAVDEARSLAVGILLGRYFTAFVDVVGASQLAAGNIVGFAACFLMSKALGYCFDQLEEGGWAKLQDSFMSIFILKPLSWIIDPSGFVYEGVISNRLSGVKATVYYKKNEGAGAVLWDASEYDQSNPLITPEDGTYAWDVPEGLWQVKYELSEYETAYSEWMEVPPPQTDVNISMVPIRAPVVENLGVYTEYVQVEFSQYMDPDTLPGIALTDEKGRNVAYTLECVDKDEDADGKVFAKKVRLMYTAGAAGNGEKVRINIPDTLISASGKRAKAVNTVKQCSRIMSINTVENVEIGVGETVKIPLLISDYDGKGITVKSEFDAVLKVDHVSVDSEGEGYIEVTGKLPGQINIYLSGTGMAEPKRIFAEIKQKEDSSAAQCKVIYCAGTEADGKPMEQIVPKGTTIEFISNPFSMGSGISFGGWFDGEQIYQPGVSYVVNNSTTVFIAVWKNQAPSHQHVYQTIVDSKPTCGNAGKQHRECTVCGIKEPAEIIPATKAHTFGEYSITQEATALAAGIKSRTCRVCGHRENTEIGKLAPKIKLNAARIVLKIKQSTSKVTVSGLAKGDSVKSWKSSNTKIVKVNQKGKITAQKKTGKATITVTLVSGKTAKISVKVQKGNVKTTKITGLKKKRTLKKGKKVSLKPNLLPITSAERIKYKTSNKKVVTVNKKGVVTGKKKGKAKVTVQAGTKKYVVTVYVK